MEDNRNLNEEELEEVPVITLADEETGEETDFEIIAEAEIDNKYYYALVAVEEDGEEYIILRAEGEGMDMTFETIDSDDEFEKVEEYFNDLLFNEIDYDEEN